MPLRAFILRAPWAQQFPRSWASFLLPHVLPWALLARCRALSKPSRFPLARVPAPEGPCGRSTLSLRFMGSRAWVFCYEATAVPPGAGEQPGRSRFCVANTEGPRVHCGWAVLCFGEGWLPAVLHVDPESS